MNPLIDVLRQSETDVSVVDEVALQMLPVNHDGMTLELVPQSDSAKPEPIINAAISIDQPELLVDDVTPPSLQQQADSILQAKARLSLWVWFIELVVVTLLCGGLYWYYSLNRTVLVAPVIESHGILPTIDSVVDQPTHEVTEVPVDLPKSELPINVVAPLISLTTPNQPSVAAVKQVHQAKVKLTKAIQYPVPIGVSVQSSAVVLTENAALGLTDQISHYQSRIESNTATADDFAQLGVLYAQQFRWHDMHSAYAEAVRKAPGQQDYHFNLAVSLERIGQPELAAKHYRQSLHQTNFVAEQARARLNAIGATQ